jgi:hypothetical protein
MEQATKMRASITAGQEGIRGVVGERGRVEVGSDGGDLGSLLPHDQLDSFCPRAVAYTARNNLTAIDPMYHNLGSLSHEQHVK